VKRFAVEDGGGLQNVRYLHDRFRWERNERERRSKCQRAR
jgi:hypothetical protein